MKFTGAALLPLASVAGAIDLNTNDEASIKSCSQRYATGLMADYKYNAADLPKEQIGYFPKPYYWWESGGIWGGLIEYTQTFGDTAYVETLQTALVANYGPKKDFIMEDKRDQQGNDDQAFWCLATMSAAEYGFPEPANAPASYLEVTENCFKNMMSRWDTGSCGGGLKWQIYPDNANPGGYHYKNSISNGAAFALAARLARYTGKSEYSDWAKTIYDWSKKVGLVGDRFEVFDGTDDKTNCATIADKTEWTYNNAMFLHGSAFMYDVTKGDSTWKDRVNGFLDRADKFFSNPDKVPDVMYEICEYSQKGCNLDQQSFKAYLSRWMAKTAVLAPFTKDKVSNYLTKSAIAAAKSCSADGKTCGTKWYKNAFDGLSGIGQQLTALEVTQALVTIKKGTLPGTGSASAPKPSSSASSAAPSSTSSASSVAPSSSSSAASTTSSSSSSSKPAPSSASATTSAKPVPSSSSSSAAPSSSSSAIPYEPKPIESKPPVTKPVESKPPVTKPVESSSVTSQSTGDKPTPTFALAPSCTSPSASTGAPVGDMKPSTSGACSCTGMKTVTVWVPPAAATPPPAYKPTPIVPPTVPTTSKNVTIRPTSPVTNVTVPVMFPGAATGTRVAGSTLLVAAAIAALSTLL